MSKILVYTGSYVGHTFPIVPTLYELQSRGHEVIVAEALVPDAGRAGAPLVEWLACLRPQVSPNALTGSRGTPQVSMEEGFTYWGEPTARELEELLVRERPDAVLIDPILWGGMISAEASGLPWVTLAHNSALIPSDGPRVFGPGASPPSGAFSRWRHSVASLAWRIGLDLRCLAAINGLRASRGLAPLAHAAQQSSRQTLTLAFTAEPFEYPRNDWHASVRFVGPGLWDAPETREPEWLTELDERPVVLVCTSSAPQEDGALVAAALAALSESEYHVVATMPSGRVPSVLPKNATVARYVPHQVLLRRAVCVICHGGFGITQKALSAGVPVVVCPFGRDQFEVARRVEVARAGVELAPWNLNPARMRAAVESALQCKPGAAHIAEAFRRAGGAHAAANAVEELLEHPRRQVSTSE